MVGIACKDARGILTSCTIKKYKKDSGPVSIGLWVAGSSANLTTFRCTFRDITSRGVYVWEGTANIRNCSFFGSAGTDPQFGVNYLLNADGTINGNSFLGFESTGGGVAIYIQGPTGEISVTANSITNCNRGIEVDSSAGPHRVAGNIIADSLQIPIKTFAPGNGHYEGNTLLVQRNPSIILAQDYGSSSNTWTGNHFSDVTSYPTIRSIAGSAGSIDATARPAVPPLSDAVDSITTSLSGPQAMAAADFNDDGDLDLAVVNTAAGTVTVHYGDGSGVFSGTPETITIALPASSPVAITAVAIDNNPNIDLVVACDSGHLVVISNTGSPSPYFPSSAGSVPIVMTPALDEHDHPVAIAAGKIDGDGNVDLLVALSGETFRPGGGLYLKNHSIPASQFTGTKLPGTYTAAQGCALADLDNDGDLDAVVTEAGIPITSAINAIRIYENNTGAFTEVTPALDAGLNPRGVTCADLDSDNLPEILVANFGDPIMGPVKGSVSVFPNQSTTGISFGTAVDTETDYGTLSLLVFDAFTDSTEDRPRLDVAAVNAFDNSISLLVHWDPIESRFNRTRSLTGLNYPFGGIVAGDVDDDGDDDVMVSDAAANKVVRFNGTTQARLAYYGRGAFGKDGLIPVIGIEGGVPAQPRMNFKITLANARPYTAALLVGSLTKADPGPDMPGLLFQTLDLLHIAFVNGSGEASYPVMIPTVPDLTGIPLLYWQWGIFDDGGEFPVGTGGIALSNGLEMRIGE